MKPVKRPNPRRDARKASSAAAKKDYYDKQVSDKEYSGGYRKKDEKRIDKAESARRNLISSGGDGKQFNKAKRQVARAERKLGFEKNEVNKAIKKASTKRMINAFESGMKRSKKG